MWTLEPSFAHYEEIVRASMEDDGRRSEENEDAVRKQTKILILSMIGSWTAQHQYTWKVRDTRYEEDAPGQVQRQRQNADGTTRMMCRTENFATSTMLQRAGPTLGDVGGTSDHTARNPSPRSHQ